MTPCSTLEQRWRACRRPVYGVAAMPYYEQAWWPPCQWVSHWGALGCRMDRRPCTSPRRHQCRTGGIQRHTFEQQWTEYADRYFCDNLPW